MEAVVVPEVHRTSVVAVATFITTTVVEVTDLMTTRDSPVVEEAVVGECKMII